VKDVQAEIARRGLATGWKEESQGLGPSDRRPLYQFVYLSGSFELSGIDGNLRLSFYNGQLMEAQFSPQQGDAYLSALRNERSNVPRHPGEEVTLDRRTKFRFYVRPDGGMFFIWSDPKLENEW
jgi:hypothetical protein